MDEHKVSMVICLKCLKRWIAVRPADVKLADLVCPVCELPGAVIETGEEIDETPVIQEEYQIQ